MIFHWSFPSPFIEIVEMGTALNGVTINKNRPESVTLDCKELLALRDDPAYLSMLIKMLVFK